MKPRKPMARKPKKEWRATPNHPTPPEAKAKSAKSDTVIPVSEKKRTKLKQVSDKRAGWLRQYEAEKKRRGNDQICFVTGDKVTIGINADWHHISGRRLLRTLLEFRACRKDIHKWIHENETEALKKGYLTVEFFRSIK